MSAFSNYLEKKLLGLTLMGSSFTAPATVWVTLATSCASDGDSYTEVPAGLGYLRKACLFVEPTSGPTWRTFLASNITFDAATTPWGTVTHFAVWDNSTIGSGNMLYWAALTSSRAVATNDVLEFSLGSGSNGLVVQLD
jgi:hypothetical protein